MRFERALSRSRVLTQRGVDKEWESGFFHGVAITTQSFFDCVEFCSATKAEDALVAVLDQVLCGSASSHKIIRNNACASPPQKRPVKGDHWHGTVFQKEPQPLTGRVGGRNQ